jgi:hypothetical protein
MPIRETDSSDQDGSSHMIKNEKRLKTGKSTDDGRTKVRSY